MSLTYMDTIDWNTTLEAEKWNSGHVHIKYILPTDLTETEVRENMLYWQLDNIWSLFKIFTISKDLMRQIQANLSEADIKQLEHEIMIDCYLVRQCFVEQITNYLTYMRQCTIKYEDALRDEHNKQKLLNRLNRMMSSWSCQNHVASFVDYDGNVLDEVIR